MAPPEPRLVILSSPPKQPTLEAFRTLYAALLTHSLLDASKVMGQSLDVAVACPGVIEGKQLSFDFFQGVLANIYRITCDICSKQGIDAVSPKYVDLRVYFVSRASADTALTRDVGPVFSMTAFAYSPRKWRVADIDGAKSGAQFLHEMEDAKKGAGPQTSALQLRDFTDVPQCELAHVNSCVDANPQALSHNIVIVGGTFDNLHEGHKLLLSATALVLALAPHPDPKHQRLMVGITGDQLLKNKKYAEALESWEDRQRNVFEFLRSIVSLDDDSADAGLAPERRNEDVPNGKACIYRLKNGLSIECVEIQDPYGPTITDESISALVVSGESRAGGQAVNDRRAEKNWALLQVFEVDVLGPEGSSELKDKISSTEKRRRKVEAAASSS